MSRGRTKPLEPLKPAQAAAADPEVHAWVAASAGTGKTQVLSARVLRLLLAGARPDAILCLTFTKLAAAEMQDRVMARLARWAGCDEAGLASDLAAIGAPTRVSSREEAGAAGAAMMAAVANGVYPDMAACIAEWVTPALGPAEAADPDLTALYARRYPAYRTARLALEPVWDGLSTV